MGFGFGMSRLDPNPIPNPNPNLFFSLERRVGAGVSCAMILMLLRHGKAEKESPTGRDVDRPLTKKGEGQAAYIAERLEKGKGPAGSAPGVILSSRAARARATAEVVAKALDLSVTFEEALLPDSPV